MSEANFDQQEYQPADFGIPERFRHFGGDGAENHIGPFFCRKLEDGAEAAFKVDSQHCNLMGLCHGGVLMTFADYALGMGLYFQTGEAAVTANQNNDFLKGAKQGDLVIAHSRVSRNSRSLGFVRVELFVGEECIFTASSIMKKLGKPFEAFDPAPATPA